MAIGCFALIISIAVLNGFEIQVAEKIIGFEGDMRISKINSESADEIFESLNNNENISQIVPFMERKGVVVTQRKSCSYGII